MHIVGKVDGGHERKHAHWFLIFFGCEDLSVLEIVWKLFLDHTKSRFDALDREHPILTFSWKEKCGTVGVQLHHGAAKHVVERTFGRKHESLVCDHIFAMFVSVLVAGAGVKEG
jgi:hypothetical protein